MKSIFCKAKQALACFLLAATVFSLAGCSQKGDFQKGENEGETAKYEIQLAELGDHVEIHTQEQAAYLNDDPQNIAAHTPAVAKTERSYPKEVQLSWNITKGEAPASAVYTVSVSTFADMRNAKTYTTTQTDYSITNLLIGTTYFWKVSFREDNVTYESDVATFTTTDQGPRTLKIDGMTNCRDIGGWKTKNGQRVKQGMIFRTAKLDSITEEGKQTLLEELGVKTEIDLRPGMSKSVLEELNFLDYGCSDAATLHVLAKVLPDIFKVLADESNYPILYHCNIGTDRTGGLTFLINALLGVAEEDLYYDYCFSNFGKLCSDSETSYTVRDPLYLENKITFLLNRTSGSTLQRKTWNYLKSLGISEKTLTTVAQILLEE